MKKLLLLLSLAFSVQSFAITIVNKKTNDVLYVTATKDNIEVESNHWALGKKSISLNQSFCQNKMKYTGNTRDSANLLALYPSPITLVLVPVALATDIIMLPVRIIDRTLYKSSMKKAISLLKRSLENNTEEVIVKNKDFRKIIKLVYSKSGYKRYIGKNVYEGQRQIVYFEPQKDICIQI